MRQFDPNTRQKLSRLYELRRQQAERLRDRRAEAIEAAHPRIAELEAERIRAGVEEVRRRIAEQNQTQLQAGDAAPLRRRRPIVPNLNRETAALTAAAEKAERTDEEPIRSLAAVDTELAAYLAQHQIDPDYQTPQYRCRICNDTGLDGEHYCSCVGQALSEINRLDGLFVPPRGMTFSAFDHQLFSDQRHPAYFGGKMSPQESIRGLRRLALDYVEHFGGQKDNLYLFGEPGTGKTFLMASIAHALGEQGYTCVFITAIQLFELMATRRTLLNSFRPDPELQDRVNRETGQIAEADLLCIDDLGTEGHALVNAYADLIALLDDRQHRGLPVIMSGNLRPGDMSERYDARIKSRLTGHFRLLLFEGPDVRVRIAEQNMQGQP